MFPIVLSAVLLLPIAQQSGSPPVTASDLTREQRVQQTKERYEPHRQAAIHLNELAAKIHSEADARVFVDAIAEELNGDRQLPWTTKGIRHRVARAEYEAVSDPTHLIAEQRIVDVWNEFSREINAPAESLVTLAEIHNLRDAMVVGDQRIWDRTDFKSIWIAPGIHALGPDGKMAGGCRAVEALKIFYVLYSQPQVLEGARKRVQQGILISDGIRPKEVVTAPRAKTLGFLQVGVHANPVLSAAVQYTRDHGARDYDRLVMRLFEEFFPKE